MCKPLKINGLLLTLINNNKKNTSIYVTKNSLYNKTYHCDVVMCIQNKNACEMPMSMSFDDITINSVVFKLCR